MPIRSHTKPRPEFENSAIERSRCRENRKHLPHTSFTYVLEAMLGPTEAIG